MKEIQETKEAKEAKINKKEQKIKEIQDAKEARQQKKEEKIKQIEIEKLLTEKQKEDKQKYRLEKKLKIQNRDLYSVLDWVKHSFNNDSLHNNSIRKLYFSYCEFMKDKKQIQIGERKFALFLQNDDNSIPFDIGYKTRDSTGKMKMIFHLTNIKNWIESNTK
jgi:hypothetical protein